MERWLRELVARGWPAVQYEELSWLPTPAVNNPSWSNRGRAHRGTYRQAVAPMIAEAEAELSAGTASLVQSVTGKLARFADQYQGEAPFGPVLLYCEATASSAIEQVTDSALRISLARLGDRSRPNATLIARNTHALDAALQLATSLDVEAILSMHRALLEDSDPFHAGRLRDQPNWIGGGSPVTAMFVPPRHADVPAALDDLVRFMARTDMPALVQAAIAHAQFETIHPFTDGNGRTGRALVSAILRARGTTKNFTIPLSSGLLTTTRKYFESLNEYRKGNIEPIILGFINAAGRAMGNVQVLMHDIEELHSKILGTAQRVTKNLRAVARLCTTEPAFTAHMVEQTGVPVSSAYTIINRLVDRRDFKNRTKDWRPVCLVCRRSDRST